MSPYTPVVDKYPTHSRDKLSSFDEGPDLVLYYKYLMVLNGETEYEFHFNETDKLSESQRHYIKKQYQLFNAWYNDWTKREAL